MGGMDFFFLEAHALIRNSPAHAGNTFYNLRSLYCCWDHLRLRGEYLSPGTKFTQYMGSPPLTRGIRG